jgi:hypothetical protein
VPAAAAPARIDQVLRDLATQTSPSVS